MVFYFLNFLFIYLIYSFIFFCFFFFFSLILLNVKSWFEKFSIFGSYPTYVWFLKASAMHSPRSQCPPPPFVILCALNYCAGHLPLTHIINTKVPPLRNPAVKKLGVFLGPKYVEWELKNGTKKSSVKTLILAILAIAEETVFKS